MGLGRASCAVSRFSAPQYQAHLPCKSHVCFASCSPQGSHAPPQGTLGRDSLGRAHSSTCLQESSPTCLKTRASKLFLAQWRRCNQPNVQFIAQQLKIFLETSHCSTISGVPRPGSNFHHFPTLHTDCVVDFICLSFLSCTTPQKCCGHISLPMIKERRMSRPYPLSVVLRCGRPRFDNLDLAWQLPPGFA